MSHSRSSNNLAYPDDDDARSDAGPQRWDRERFERMRARSRGPSGPSRSSESFSYEESDRYSRGGGGSERSRFQFNYEDDERYGPVPERERERAPRRPDPYYYDEDDRAPPARSRPAFLDERVDISGRELMRRDRDRDRDSHNRWTEDKTDIDVHIRENEREREPSRRPPPPRPAAPPRKHSSDDERSRYDDRENINLEINIQPPPAPAPPPPRPDYYDPGPRYPRPVPPPRRYYDEYEEEDIRYRRERDRSSYRGSFESSESFEEIEVAPKRDPRFKRGKTRMPKRLVHKRAIVELGCPFEEEEFFYVIQVALFKEQIDEVIRISETYRESETSKKTLQLEAPPPRQEPVEETSETTKTLKIIENPTPSELARYKRLAENAEANGAVVIEGDSAGGGNEEEEEEQEVEVNETSSTTTTGRSGTTKTTSRSKETSKTSSTTHAAVGPSGKRGRSRQRPRGEEVLEETKTKTVEEEEDDYETETRRGTRRGNQHRGGDENFHERFYERQQEFEEDDDFHERFRNRDFNEREQFEYDTETVVDDHKLGAPMTMVVREPSRRHNERDLKAEIRALEDQRALLTARRSRGLSLVEDDDFDVVRVEKRRDKSRHRSKSRRRSTLGERLRSKSRHREPWVDNAVIEGDYDYEIVERKDTRDLFGGRKSFVEDKDVEVRFDTTERRNRARDLVKEEVVEKVDVLKVDEESSRSRAKSRDRRAKRLAETALVSLT